MITDLRAMMEERLLAFMGQNQNMLPSRILVYRDGVSEVIPLISTYRTGL